MNFLNATFGGHLGASIGSILWAKYIQWTGNTAGFIAVGIGRLTGIGILLTRRFSIPANAKTAWYLVGGASAFFAVIGIFMGKYLDVPWNAMTQITEQLIREYYISAEEAEPSAKTLFHGQSVWELMRVRMSRIHILYAATAAFIAFRIPTLKFSRLFR